VPYDDDITVFAIFSFLVTFFAIMFAVMRVQFSSVGVMMLTLVIFLLVSVSSIDGRRIHRRHAIHEATGAAAAGAGTGTAGARQRPSYDAPAQLRTFDPNDHLVTDLPGMPQNVNLTMHAGT
jgi:hypothetical protein